MTDPLLELTEEQRAIVETARAFADEQLRPNAAAWDRDAHFEPSLIPALGELGFLGMLLPAEYDGLALDARSYLLALEEIAVADASTAVMMSVHNSLPTQMLLTYGSEAQKQRFLAPMARGELLGGFALSEPDSGSDAASLRCQARRDGDHWILDGAKSWVTSGTHAGVILVMARTDSPDARRGAKGISAFIITPDLPGFSVGKKEDKMGMRASPTVQLVFDGMRVPADRLLGEEGMGFTYAMQSLEHGRLGIAAQAIGIARAAYEAACAYVVERKQFGSRSPSSRRCSSSSPTWRPASPRRGACSTWPPPRRIAASISARRPPWRSSSPARPRCGSPLTPCSSSAAMAM
jgi:alkylation response protein AidB-like acyl-CoA dehydrogenase